LASGYPVANFHTANLVTFANDVDRATAGKLKITVHPNAALFKAPDIKRAVQSGQAQAGEILLVNFQEEWQIFGADGLPFLADSYADASKLYRAQRPVLERKLADQGMVLAYAAPWPPQGLFSKKLIATASDLKGNLWRAYSPATTRMAELIGAQSVTIQVSELSQALLNGKVDAMMTSAATGIDNHLSDYLKYYYDMQAWLPKNAVLFNKKAFDALDKATKAQLLQAATDAEERGWAASRRVHLEAVERLKSQGVQVLNPSTQFKADLRRIGDIMLLEWFEKSGAEGKSLINAYTKP
jgi:TRAP-type C4-dicarboxylate transport system substrate-binding protein